MPENLEDRLTRLEGDFRRLRDVVVGGGEIAWERSIQGRLYDVRQTLLAADKLSEAVREVRRERARQWRTWEKLLLFVFAGATAIAPYVLLVAR